MDSAVVMRSVSGVRGIVGEGLTPETVIRHIKAFSRMLAGKKVAVGRDSRVSGPFIAKLVTGTLMACGKDVIDLGIVPTPTVQFMVEKLGTAGGIVITASHNPIMWNGLKFIGQDGLFLPPDQVKILFEMADEDSDPYVSFDLLGEITERKDAIDIHINTILGLPFIQPELISEKKLKVVVDTVNGAGGRIIPKLLESLGCEVILLNQEMTGKFAHTPEPVPENLTQLQDKVKESKADLGFAVDPDVDRCAIVDENGNPLGEEYTLALAVKFMLSKKLGPVVTNLSTSRVIDDLGAYYNSIVYRTPVGEIHVAKKMREVGAVIGGEGNGGVILPDVHLGRDAPVAVALICQLLAEENRSISSIKSDLNQYFIVKDKIPVEGINAEHIFAYFKQKFSEHQLNETDGLKIDFPDHWIHLRKSNTEPIIRIMVEASAEERAKKIVDEIKKEIGQLSESEGK